MQQVTVKTLMHQNMASFDDLWSENRVKKGADGMLCRLVDQRMCLWELLVKSILVRRHLKQFNFLLEMQLQYETVKLSLL